MLPALKLAVAKNQCRDGIRFVPARILMTKPVRNEIQ